jgi:hypothetical protein
MRTAERDIVCCTKQSNNDFPSIVTCIYSTPRCYDLARYKKRVGQLGLYAGMAKILPARAMFKLRCLYERQSSDHAICYGRSQYICQSMPASSSYRFTCDGDKRPRYLVTRD